MWPFCKTNFFVERIADALRDAALNLPAGEHRIEHAADLLHRPEFLDLGGVGDSVDGHLRNLNRPCKGRIGFAVIFLIVPDRFPAAARSGREKPLRH